MKSEDGLLRMRTARRPRHGRSADFWSRLQPLDDASGDGSSNAITYETRYDVSRGYTSQPVIADEQ